MPYLTTVEGGVEQVCRTHSDIIFLSSAVIVRWIDGENSSKSLRYHMPGQDLDTSRYHMHHTL